MNLYFILAVPALMVLIYLAVWAGEHLADCQDEIEKDIDSNRVESFLRETSQT